MPVPSVTLSGEALYGVHAPTRHLTAALPQTVRLGRVRRKAEPPVLRLANYFVAATPPPPSLNRRDNAAASMARMYLNDTYGDCVIAGKAHALGLWSANDPDSGGLVLATDQEILSQYHGICGPGDNGCVITDVLDVMRAKGFQAGGKLYKIDGYVSCDWTNKLMVQVVQYLFGASTIGINLPEAWTRNAVWDVTDTPIVGGHDVTPCDYDEKGVYVASWGRIYLVTWAAFQSKRWLEEYYALLSPLWYNADKMAVNGIDATTLAADMAKLATGVVPPITTDPPSPPPPPPNPPPFPPPPWPVTGVATGTIHIPAGLGAKTVTVSLPVTGKAGPTSHLEATFSPWLQGLVRWAVSVAAAKGPQVLAVVEADVAAGKTPWQITQDVLAVLFATPPVEGGFLQVTPNPPGQSPGV